MARYELLRITAEVPIIGFTGALGSGCTFFAETLAKHHNYSHCRLSEPIREEARRRGLEETTENLQDVGNDLRRDRDLDWLVKTTLETADKEWPEAEAPERPTGIIIDTIRNTAEAEAIKQWPNGYVISVQADREKRRERLLKKGKFRTPEEFDRADERDAEERTRFGQQVKRCNHLADVVVINDRFVSELADEGRRAYVDNKLYDRYVTLIERIARGDRRFEHQPTRDETLMTVAYCESLRSSCLKRRVGAVIVEKGGAVVSIAHNDVPEGAPSCLNHPDYQWCARDIILESFAAKLKKCPSCGADISVDCDCVVCGQKLSAFTKRCPSCYQNPEIDYGCPRCKVRVFQTHLPGGGSAGAGKLLDMCRALHAEETAIINLVKTGISDLSRATIYTTTFPCNQCANKIVGAGIGEVVYSEPYTMKEAWELFKEKGTKIRRFEGVKSEAYFRLYGLWGEKRRK